MQEQFENSNQNTEHTENNEQEFSTIFSDPTAHSDKEKKSKNKNAIRIISGVLAVIVLVGAIFGVKKWLPEKQNEDAATLPTERIYAVNSAEIKEVIINNASGELRIYKEELATSINSSAQTKTVVMLDGYDNELIDTASLEQIINSVASLDAYGKYEADDLAAYGLDKSEVSVKIIMADGEFTVSFGNDTNDHTRCYALISSAPETVFLVGSNSKATVDVTAFDLAISTGIAPIEKTDKNAKYFDEEGSLSSFDSIVLSGKRFPDAITFKPNTDGAFSSYAGFITTTPQKRIAAKTEELRDLFGTVTSSSACVSFDKSAESLKKFGLDDPDIVVTMNIAGEAYTYYIAAQEGTTSNFYVTATNDKLIRTVPITYLPFANYKEKDFYTLFMVLEAFADVSCFELAGEVNASFDISYDEDNEEHIVKYGETVIDSEKFQSAYADFISTTGIDISVIPTDSATTLTIKLHHKDGSEATSLSFKKVGETRYQYYVGGTPMGQITSTAYNGIVRSFSAFLKSE